MFFVIPKRQIEQEAVWKVAAGAMSKGSAHPCERGCVPPRTAHHRMGGTRRGTSQLRHQCEAPPSCMLAEIPHTNLFFASTWCSCLEGRSPNCHRDELMKWTPELVPAALRSAKRFLPRQLCFPQDDFSKLASSWGCFWNNFWIRSVTHCGEST